MDCRKIAKVIERALRGDKRIMGAWEGGESGIMLGAWGERKTQVVVAVDDDGQQYDITVIPTSPPSEATRQRSWRSQAELEKEG